MCGAVENKEARFSPRPAMPTTQLPPCRSEHGVRPWRPGQWTVDARVEVDSNWHHENILEHVKGAQGRAQSRTVGSL